MKIKVIQASMTVLVLNSGTEVLFSYETPVAIYQPKVGYRRTDRKWSNTTTRHINKWMGVGGNTIPQEELELIVDAT